MYTYVQYHTLKHNFKRSMSSVMQLQ